MGPIDGEQSNEAWMARVRLVATDLDGTLLRSDGSISERTRTALSRLEPAGIGLVFITARPARWMSPIAAMTGHAGVAVCANGAVTFDLRTERVTDARTIDGDTARQVVSRLREAVPGGTFAVEAIEGFACEPGYMQHQWDEERGSPVAAIDELLTRPPVKMLFGHPDWTADDLLPVARRAVGDLAEVTHSNPDRAAIEMSAFGVSKASGLARLCDARGIEPAEVVAFGDMPNDLPLLAWAGTSFAVANAHPDVLAAVSRSTAANDEDGVAAVLERVLAGRRTRPS